MLLNSGRFWRKRSNIIISFVHLRIYRGNIWIVPKKYIPKPYHQPITIFQLHGDMDALSRPRALCVCACAVRWLLPGAQRVPHIRLNFMSATWSTRVGIDIALPPHFRAMRQHLPTKSSSCQQLKLKGLKIWGCPWSTWISMSLLSSIMRIVNFKLKGFVWVQWKTQ